jgi:hypothetical protein
MINERIAFDWQRSWSRSAAHGLWQQMAWRALSPAR